MLTLFPMGHSRLLVEQAVRRIFLIRGQKVMLDRDLAELYGVHTFRLNEQVKRNIKRFPADFMFRVNLEEAISLRSQFAILKRGRGRHRKYLQSIFEAIRQLMAPPQPLHRRIGFHSD